MNDLTVVQDIQSLFASHAAQDDFLQVGKLEDTIGLCLSGGGYRAMIYHVGALIRLNELGFLPRLAEVASVSGGSITAGLLALRWPALRFNEDGRAVNLDALLVSSLLRFAGKGIDIKPPSTACCRAAMQATVWSAPMIGISLRVRVCRTSPVSRASPLWLRIYKLAAAGASGRATRPTTAWV